MGWSLYVWFHVKTFGPQSECNDSIKYVFFFANIRSTAGWFVKGAIAFVTIGAIIEGRWLLFSITALLDYNIRNQWILHYSRTETSQGPFTISRQRLG